MIRINNDEKQCYVDDNPVELTKQEYKLLVFLIDNSPKIFSRGELIAELWDSKVALKTVDMTISRLRKKIGEKYIVTRNGFGYGYKKPS